MFQSRFKSTIIENDGYLIQSIEYLLQNPVRAGIVPHAGNYIWSSVSYYFSNQKKKIVDVEFVNQLFGSKGCLLGELTPLDKKELPVKMTKHGEVLGSENFLKLALKRHNRRQIPLDQSIGVQRKDDRYFDTVEKVVWEFKNIHGVNFDEIDTGTWTGKRLRGELLVLLKDKAGLKYKEISEISVFSNLSFTSLGDLYQRTRKRAKGKEVSIIEF